MILKKYKLAGFFLLLLLMPFLAQAQILDDSTQQVYGPTTTRFFLEKDILANKDRAYTVDTVLDNFHNYNFVNRYGNRYQDLGNLGTAIRPIFYTPPTQIGTYFGINVYDLYAYTPDNIKYYDTKSPYTSVYYAQGGLLQQILGVDFSRNIRPNWNAGFTYQRITAPKQFGYANREDRQTDNQTVAVYTRYQNKDSTYQLLAHFSHLNHGMVDQGGIRRQFMDDEQTILQPPDSLFGYEEETAILRNARSRDYRNHYHLYHQYAFARGFQVYHIFDRMRHVYDYRDAGLQNDASGSDVRIGSLDFYRATPDGYYFRPDTTDLSMRFLLHENQVGLKGSLANLDYRVYVRRRDFRVGHKPAYIDKRTGAENFIGGRVNYNLSDSAQIHAEAEYLLFRDYRLQVVYENKFWRIGHHRLYYSPTFLQQQIQNNHFIWDNKDFRNTLSDNTFAYFNIRNSWLTFSPFATFSNIKNLVYYDTLALPQQERRSVQVLSVGLNFGLVFKKFHLVTQAVYTKVTGRDIIRIPEQFANGRLYYQNELFKGALETQIGVDVHYKSTYKPYGYMPATGQFHLQDDFTADGYIVGDVFVNVRIRRVRLFVKMAHANQDLPEPGYFVAPYYTGLKRTFAFGVNWLLFD